MPAPNNVDLSAVVYNVLKEGDLGLAVRALLVGGADSVYEAGDLTAEMLSAAENARRGDSDLEGKALALAVQDAGEDKLQRDTFRQYVVVRVYDRFRGYRNIRSARHVLRACLYGFIGTLVEDGVRQGLAHTEFVGRTGHRYDLTYAVEYEAITFIGTVQWEEID